MIEVFTFIFGAVVVFTFIECLAEIIEEYKERKNGTHRTDKD